MNSRVKVRNSSALPHDKGHCTLAQSSGFLICGKPQNVVAL
jgi:hypothetical protein